MPFSLCYTFYAFVHFAGCLISFAFAFALVTRCHVTCSFTSAAFSPLLCCRVQFGWVRLLLRFFRFRVAFASHDFTSAVRTPFSFMRFAVRFSRCRCCRFLFSRLRCYRCVAVHSGLRLFICCHLLFSAVVHLRCVRSFSLFVCRLIVTFVLPTVLQHLFSSPVAVFSYTHSCLFLLIPSHFLSVTFYCCDVPGICDVSFSLEGDTMVYFGLSL